ncbi:UDP binding domain-containing protein [Streptomyces lydicus]|uniref:UDP binding domain-containing protein n=1 Tax=Streptomyces lydicus TaxID=47763 RepID=UPI0036F62DC7
MSGSREEAGQVGVVFVDGRVALGCDSPGRPDHQRITVWGAAFKPETDDIRDSPALAVTQALHDLGACVTVADPKAIDNARKLHTALDYADDPIAAVQDADLLLHLTEWPAYRHIDPGRLTSRVASWKAIDARGTLSADDCGGAG